MKSAFYLCLALALFARTVVCDEETTPEENYDENSSGPPGEEGYGGGGDDEGGYGGGGPEGGEGPDGGAPPAGGKATELTSVEEFDAFIDNAEPAVIGAFAALVGPDPYAVLPDGWDVDEDGEWEAPVVEHPSLTSFNEIAGAVVGYRYAYTASVDVLAKLKQKSSAGLYLYRSPKFASVEHGDRMRERFPSDKLVQGAVTNWLSAKAQTLVSQYSFMSKDRYTGPTCVIFMNLDWENNAKGVAYVLKRARKVAAKFKGKVAFAVAALADMQYELTDYGLTPSAAMKSDVLYAIRSEGGYDATYYAGDAAFSGPALEAFTNKYLAGELVAYVKPPPSEEDEPEPEDGESTKSDDDVEDRDEM